MARMGPVRSGSEPRRRGVIGGAGAARRGCAIAFGNTITVRNHTGALTSRIPNGHRPRRRESSHPRGSRADQTQEGFHNSHLVAFGQIRAHWQAHHAFGCRL